MKKAVFVLDDEQDIVDLVKLHLGRSGYAVEGFVHPRDLFSRFSALLPALVILDLMLPETNGIEVCRRMKNDSRLHHIPIIMLTAKRDESDKVLGLDLGADDYITKPFSPRELVARVKAVLRRGGGDEADEVLAIAGDIRIDTGRHEVRLADDTPVTLTNMEWKILLELARKKGWVLTREKLLSAVWGSDAYVVDRNIDVHITHLREKLGDAGKHIVNIRGVGYKIEE
jgi:DNA-binding response OmpR family regulator